jgi:hypothetical protein
MTAVEELVETLTNAGLTWGRPASFGFPEIRVKNASGTEYSVTVLRFSFFVTIGGSTILHQRLTVADVLDTIRHGVA